MRLRLLIVATLLVACGRTEELAACDITRADCQQDVYYAVLRLRGDGFDPFGGRPPIRTLTSDEYRAELEARQRAAQSAEPDATPKLDAWSIALRWLGLLGPDQSSGQSAIDDAVTHVAAFYSWRSQDVTVIEGQVHDDVENTAVLAHELVHAFQQRDTSAASEGPTTEHQFLYAIRFEGEAVHYETLARVEMADQAPWTSDLDAYYDRWLQLRRAAVRPAHSRYDEVSWLMYPLGGELWTRRWLQGGNAGVRKLQSELPTTSLTYMLRGSGVDLHSDTLRCVDAAPAASFERVRSDRLGALRLFGFLVGAGPSDDDAWRLALDWRDDVLWVYADEAAEQVAVSWRIRLASAHAAQAVADAAKPIATLRASRDGNDVLIVASDPALADWTGAIDCR